MRVLNCGVCGQDGHENKNPGWECIDALRRLGEDRRVREALTKSEVLVEGLQKRVKELEARSRAGFCMYCGETFTYKDESEESIKSVYEAALSHDGVCAKNPIVKERDSLKAQLERAKKFAKILVESGLDFDDDIWKKEVIEVKGK